eukprot:13971350-Alexandrium_andersonii.AAC.1
MILQFRVVCVAAGGCGCWWLVVCLASRFAGGLPLLRRLASCLSGRHAPRFGAPSCSNGGAAERRQQLSPA